MATVSLPPNGTAPPPHLSRRETSISDKKNLKFGLFHGNLQNCFPSQAAAAHCYEALSKLEASINLLRQHIEPHPAQFCFFPPEPAPASRQLPVRHTLPVFLRITPDSELNQSAWQTAYSMLFGPDIRIRPVRTEQATRSDCSSQHDILGRESRRVTLLLSKRAGTTPRPLDPVRAF